MKNALGLKGSASWYLIYQMSNRRYAFSIFLIILLPFFLKVNKKNTCETFLHYLLINFNGYCYYNPDVTLTTPQVIEKYAGKIQEYTIKTEDGYILMMFRIPQENPIGVILLQPPISGGSMAWLSDNGDSLGITLWKRGYEVWFSNHRGSAHSRKHVNLTESDALFWNFSFHEIALYDFDPQFELIYKETNNSQIIYVGYSMSSTAALAYAALKPKNSVKFIKSYILLSPVSILKNFKSVFRYVLYLMKPFERFFAMREFTALESVRWLGGFLNVVPLLINYAQCLVVGWTSGEMDSRFYPYLLAHHAKGISTKMIYHYGQIYFNQTDFVMYDYGKETNNIIYGTDLPPPYPLQAVRNPLYIIYGDSDAFCTPRDVEILTNKLLPRKVVKAVIEVPNHNHIDFIFSKHRRKKIYENIYAILKKIK